MRPDVHVAAVVSADGIRFAAVDTSQEALLSRVAAYVQEHAGTMLWPRDAKHVHRLLDDGSLEAAITRYFDLVGERWDPEYLHRAVTKLGGFPSGARPGEQIGKLSAAVGGLRR